MKFIENAPPPFSLLGCTDMSFLVSDTGMGMTRRIPVSGECLFVFFFSLLRHIRHTSGEKKKEKKRNHRF